MNTREWRKTDEEIMQMKSEGVEMSRRKEKSKGEKERERDGVWETRADMG